MQDPQLISYHSRMDRAIPGEGLMSDPENPWPWEKPPRFTSVIEASEYIFSQFIDDDLNPIILDAMEDEIPIMDITRFVLFKGFSDGLWNPDLLLLLVEPTAYILLALAERSFIDPIIYNEEDEDEISDDLQTFTDNKALDDLRNYSKDKGIPKGALSENITQQIEELPEGRPSLLAKPDKPSLLERTA